MSKLPPTCRIAINPPDEFFNVNDNSIEVEPGTEVLIRVKPQELVMDDAVIDIPLEKRGCRMASEVQDEMNKYVTVRVQILAYM